MRIIGADDVATYGDYLSLSSAIRDLLRRAPQSPQRAHHEIQVPGSAPATLLTMPAWEEGGYLGVKIAAVFPGNAALSKPSISSQYLLMSAKDGEMLALIEGGELTARRTAAASALASGYLSRDDAASLTIIGTGRLAPHLLRAHLAMRPAIASVRIWGRSAAKSAELAGLDWGGLDVQSVTDLEGAVRSSDIISVATLSRSPLVRGEWLKPGAHLDLVGGFTPQMRETDDEAVRRARVFCDNPAALTECGDLADPIAAGIVGADQVITLKDLCAGDEGRQTQEQITLFKSVGFAAEDLAAAVHIYKLSSAPPLPA